MKTMCPLVYHHSGFVELYIQKTVKKYNSTTRKYNSTFLIYIYIYIDRYIYNETTEAATEKLFWTIVFFFWLFLGCFNSFLTLL